MTPLCPRSADLSLHVYCHQHARLVPTRLRDTTRSPRMLDAECPVVITKRRSRQADVTSSLRECAMGFVAGVERSLAERAAACIVASPERGETRAVEK